MAKKSTCATVIYSLSLYIYILKEKEEEEADPLQILPITLTTRKDFLIDVK